MQTSPFLQARLTARSITRRMSPLNGRTKNQYPPNFRRLTSSPQTTLVSVDKIVRPGFSSLTLKFQTPRAKPGDTGRSKSSRLNGDRLPVGRQNLPVTPSTISSGWLARTPKPESVNVCKVIARFRGGTQPRRKINSGSDRNPINSLMIKEPPRSAVQSALFTALVDALIAMLCVSTASGFGANESISIDMSEPPALAGG